MTNNDTPVVPARTPVTLQTVNSTPKSATVVLEKKTKHENAVNDIWYSIEQGLGFSQHLDNHRIGHFIHWYNGNQVYFDRTLKRANLYLAYVAGQVKESKLPMEIALLPFIESAYNPFAYSPSKAAGLWQFMPSTGAGFGLQQSYWFEARNDIIMSTKAAIAYLKQLNSQFQGDWLLTLAAYNAGPGTIRRAIKENKKLGRPTDFWSLRLPQQTMDYVPRLIALAKVLSNPQDYAINRISIPVQTYFDTVSVPAPIDLHFAAKITGLPAKKLYDLNPALTRKATPPQGPYQLLIPLAQAEKFREKLVSIPQKRWLTINEYTVKSGDNLWNIARQYNVSVQDLLQWNELSKTALLQPGQKLNLRIASQPGKKQQVIYKIKKGDSLFKIAQQFKVNIQEILTWNNLQIDQFIRPEQFLSLYPSH